MPYIKAEDRLRLEIDPTDIRTAGDLNYLIFKHAKSRFANYQSLNDIVTDIELLIDYYQNKVSDNPILYDLLDMKSLCHYATRHLKRYDIVGALRCCELEIYRRLAGPYEDKAIEKNGDVE